MAIKKDVRIKIDGTFHHGTLHIPYGNDSSEIEIHITETEGKLTNFSKGLIDFMKYTFEPLDFEIHYRYEHVANIKGAYPRFLNLSFKHLVLVGKELEYLINEY